MLIFLEIFQINKKKKKSFKISKENNVKIHDKCLPLKRNFLYSLNHIDLKRNASNGNRMPRIFSFFRFIFEFEYNSGDTTSHINTALKMGLKKNRNIYIGIIINYIMNYLLNTLFFHFHINIPSDLFPFFLFINIYIYIYIYIERERERDW